MAARDLIERAINHLSEVGLKKGTFAHTSVRGEDLRKSPVCGVGAVRFMLTRNPHFPIPTSHPGYRDFVLVINKMNEAACREDFTIPPGPDAFMIFNDDPDTTKDDVIRVMREAAEAL